VYRGEATVLARTWEALEAAAGEAREARLAGKRRVQGETTPAAPLGSAFAARQAAWDQDRHARADEKRRMHEAAAMTAPRHRHTKGASLAKAAAATRALAAEEPPPPPRQASAFEPVLKGRHESGSSQPWQPSGMAERWLAQAKAKVESELCALGFGRRAVKAAMEAKAAMETKAATEAKAAMEASDPGAVARCVDGAATGRCHRAPTRPSETSSGSGQAAIGWARP
jgi:hypothetical protein